MQLDSRIIAKSSIELNTALLRSFDHPFQIVDSSSYSFSSLCQQIATLGINANQSQVGMESGAVCFVTLNVAFRLEYCSHLLSKLGKDWKYMLSEFDPRDGTIKQIAKQTDKNQFDNTYILELARGQKNSIKIYFLPIRSASHPNSNSRAIRESLKLFRVIRSYLSFKQQLENNFYLQDDFCLDLSQYLYLERVAKIHFVLNLEGDQTDNKILQNLGEIKLPPLWLQKQQWQLKKQQIYCLQRDEWLILKDLRRIKSQTLNPINQVRALTNLNQERYQDMNIENLKKLKAQGLNEKIKELKQLQYVMTELDIRLHQLQNRRRVYQLEKSQLLKTHHKQTMHLKKDMNALQNQQSISRFYGSQRMYKPAKQSSKNFTISIARQVSKKIKSQDEKLQIHTNKIGNTNRFESQLEKQNETRLNGYKFAEKKFATVIKEGFSASQQADRYKMREEYQNLVINADFEAEKKLQAEQNRYLNATAVLRRLIEANEDSNSQA